MVVRVSVRNNVREVGWVGRGKQKKPRGDTQNGLVRPAGKRTRKSAPSSSSSSVCACVEAAHTASARPTASSSFHDADAMLVLLGGFVLKSSTAAAGDRSEPDILGRLRVFCFSSFL
jgi:hypothetical protein